ncbi:hypothetical protein AX16_008853 [Volvariella volvacea WC 439]|nr:hypothetical protein AX16_008853 [Volvariella volvacea WC 439]
MSTESEQLLSTTRRMPTLTQLCQRVATAHIDSISGFGDELTFKLVKPILERCSAEQLSRLENASPHLAKDTPAIWKELCQRKYPTAVERYLATQIEEPELWRDQYFSFHEAEDRRLKEVSSKLRSQRQEAEAYKKGREVKLTDRVPPPKRVRTGWGAPSQPRTLFQKTKNETHKIQKAMYQARIIPPMPTGKTFRVLSNPSGPTLPPPPSPAPNQPNRMTANSIAHRPSSATAQVSLLTKPQNSAQHVKALTPPAPKPNQSSDPGLRSVGAAVTNSRVEPPSSSSAPPNSVEPRLTKKKDPMASMFVPKHRAYSQRPT